MWVLDEPLEKYEIGTEVPLPAGASRLQDRSLVVIDGVTAVLKYLPEGAKVQDYVRERRAMLADDPRVLSVQQEARTLLEAVGEMVKVSRASFGAASSPLSGPETSEPWLKTVTTQGHGSLVTRHDKWSAESGVNRNSGPCHEHSVLSRAVQLGATVDGINVMNSVAFELLLRRLQLIEEAVNEVPDQPSFEGARHFMGIADARGGAYVAPSLKRFVADELGKEAAIMKEKRKAREARKGNPGQKGGGRGKGENPAAAGT